MINNLKSKIQTIIILSPSFILPSAKAEPFSLIFVTYIPTSSGMCGTSTPPCMLNPKPEIQNQSMKFTYKICFFTKIIINFTNTICDEVIHEGFGDNKACPVILSLQVWNHLTDSNMNGKSVKNFKLYRPQTTRLASELSNFLQL